MYRCFLKRILDLSLTICVLLIIWPILLIIIIFLHFANKGAGVFFTQNRPGKDAKIFKAIKFKTMTDERDAEGKLLPDAQRLTKVGRIVRSLVRCYLNTCLSIPRNSIEDMKCDRE